MIGKIISINDNSLKVEFYINLEDLSGLINTHVKISDDKNTMIGEITNIENKLADINLVGQIINNKFIPAITSSVSFSSNIELINQNDLELILGKNSDYKFNLGTLPLYGDTNYNISLNSFLSNHFAIFGNTGSGKSCSISRILQNIFSEEKIPYRANIFIFDAYGEYKPAFTSFLESKSDYLKFKSITTNIHHDNDEELLRIPLWLLDSDDIAILLSASESSQIEVIKKTIKLVKIFSVKTKDAIKHKNNIIAKSLLSILGSGKSPVQIRDQIISILTTYNTEDLNLDSKVVLPGYTRTLRQCFMIDAQNKINEMQLVTEFINSFVEEASTLSIPNYNIPYNLDDFKTALSFALIDEGIFESDKVFDYANILKVRLDTLINDDYKQYFEYPEYLTKEEYIKSLLYKDGQKAQIINFNISHVDDKMGKCLAKIFSKMLFDYATNLKLRASIPFHIIVEEAHRYIQNDNDINLLGYNIFDRITKEGRKYGVILGLISQRPSEISETAVSQCSNFLIFRMYHPKDLLYIKQMVPNMSESLVKKLKTLHPGTCISFGSSFLIPFIVNIKMPNPSPASINCNVEKVWYMDNL